MSNYVHKRRSIRLDGKLYQVAYDETGPISIKYRSVKYRGKPYECIYEACLWHRAHKQPKFRVQPGSRTRRILSLYEELYNVAG